MEETKKVIPFDPDFDSGIHPLMAFYAGLACSVLVFGLAGIIFLLTLIY